MTPHQERLYARRPELRDRLDAMRGTGVTPPAPTLLRPPSVAKTCIHLEPRYISNGEAHNMGEQLRDTAAKLNTRCSGCNGRTTLQRCNGGGGVNGLTTLAWCSAKCVDKFQPKEAT